MTTDQKTLEPLTAEWIELICRMEETAGDVRWSRTDFEKELTSPISRFFVLQEGSNILGYGGYWKVGHEAQLTNLVIEPRHRRQGLGRWFLKALLEQAVSEGCRTSTLELRSQNHAAKALYEEAGYALQGRRPNLYTAPTDDALLMEKIL